MSLKMRGKTEAAEGEDYISHEALRRFKSNCGGTAVPVDHGCCSLFGPAYKERDPPCLTWIPLEGNGVVGAIRGTEDTLSACRGHSLPVGGSLTTFLHPRTLFSDLDLTPFGNPSSHF